jgi:hypothetical protein
MIDVVKDPSGKIEKVRVEIVEKEKTKGVIHWVSKEHSITCHVNLYQVLFTEQDVISAAAKKKCDFREFLNPDSLIQRREARIWNLHKDA